MKNEFSPGDKVWCYTLYPSGHMEIREFIVERVIISLDRIEYAGCLIDKYNCPNSVSGIKEDHLSRTKEGAKKKCIGTLIFEKNKLIEATKKEIEELEHSMEDEIG